MEESAKIGEANPFGKLHYTPEEIEKYKHKQLKIQAYQKERISKEISARTQSNMRSM